MSNAEKRLGAEFVLPELFGHFIRTLKNKNKKGWKKKKERK